MLRLWFESVGDAPQCKWFIL